MKLSVDRIDEGFAVCQDFLTDKMLAIPLAVLPKNVKEGDVIRKNKAGFFFIDEYETNERRHEIKKLQNRIFGDLLEE